MDLAVEAHQSMYDNALMGILQNCGKLQPFLDAIFCFLARRTDFYILMKHERAKMGFPPGVAEGMVQQAFKKYEILTRKREAEIMREEETQKVEKMSLEVLPPKSAKKPDSTRGANEDELPIVIPEDPSQGGEGGGGGGQSTESTTPPKKAPAAGTKEKKKSAKKVSKGQKDRTTAFNYTSDVFNGGDMDAYKWSQTITEVEIKVILPENTTGKHVRVDIRSEYLKIEILKPEHKVILDGKLTNKVKVDDSMWNVDRETSTLCVNLEKVKEVMWKSVLEGEEGIDLTKVDTTRDISEFDAEAQAAIQRVSYDHHMKMQGLPTSSDKKAHEVLRKAWNAEGSPFKGTPFDPSRVQISGTWN